MRIGTFAQQLGTTPHAIRFYERHGLLPAATRTENGYREYTEGDSDRLRLLIGLRKLDLPLTQAAELASLCAEGECEKVSRELGVYLIEKRRELAARVEELRFLDQHLARLAGELGAGGAPRLLITTERRNAMQGKRCPECCCEKHCCGSCG